MSEENNITFHGATITEFYLDAHNVYLSAEDVWVGGDSKFAKITIHDYVDDKKLLSIDEGLECKSLMKEEDGEILTLDYTIKSLVLIVEWNNFELKGRETAAYEFNGKSVILETSNIQN